MHIVIDARMLNSSGIGTYLQNVIGGLEKEKHKITVLGDVKQLKRFESFVNIVSFTSPIYSIQEQLNYCKIIPQCDLFWSPHYNVPLVGTIKSEVRLVTIHDVYHLAFYRQLSLKQKLYAKFVIKRAVEVSDKIITVSNFSKHEILKYTGCSADKIEVIHNGVTLKGSIAELSKTKIKYNLPEKYILFVGNVKPHKNLSTLLDAYSMLDKTIQSKYKLVIVGKKDGFITGDKALFNSFDNDYKFKDNVMFTGYVEEEDMDNVYKQASLFVFPSTYEGFGLPPLEAMANDCPVIVSSSSSMPEVCGDAARYFESGDGNAICQLITHVLNSDSEKARMINKGRERVKRFSGQSSVNSHNKLFNNFLH